MPQEESFANRYWKLLLYLKPDQLRRKQALEIILCCIFSAEQALPPADASLARECKQYNNPPNGPGKQVNE